MTTARTRVLLLVLAATGLTYLDRVCISAAAPSITRDLGLSTLQMGLVFSVFALSYGLFEVPMGWLGDRWGQRRMMTRIVACWSVFTALTGLAFSYRALVAVRFGFGAAEAGAFPTLARVLARWYPDQERGRVNGLMWMGARIGGSVAPSLAVLLIGVAGWRATFFLFGLIGVVWCLVFWSWFRDDPATHPAVDKAELAYIRGGPVAAAAHPRDETPWGRIFSSGSLWALFWMYFATSYGFFFLVTWLPTYLIREHGLTQQRAGFYAGVPLAVGAVACLTGGLLSDWLVARTGSLKWGRRIVGFGGYTLAALGYALAALADGPLASVVCLALAAGAMDMAVPVAWATCLEVGGRFGGTTTGFMNTSSSLSAMISPLAAAWLFDQYGSFSAMFASASAVYLLAGLLWFRIDPTRAVAD